MNEESFIPGEIENMNSFRAAIQLETQITASLGSRRHARPNSAHAADRLRGARRMSLRRAVNVSAAPLGRRQLEALKLRAAGGTQINSIKQRFSAGGTSNMAGYGTRYLGGAGRPPLRHSPLFSFSRRSHGSIHSLKSAAYITGISFFIRVSGGRLARLRRRGAR